jgi:long-subunit fatty acid transport protein
MNWFRPALFAAMLLSPATALAGGFEIGDNTALANARGGTGVVSKSDPSANYFNPGRLSFADGFQLMLDANVIDLNLDFQRAPLTTPSGTQEFAPVSNNAPPFPVPYFGLSWDLGLEDLTVALTVQGPSAVGRRCMTEIVDGECIADFENGARGMLIGTNLIQVYFLAGVAYAFDVADGKLSVGVSGGPVYQDSELSLVVDQVGTNVGPPYTEDPNGQAVFRAKNLTAWRPGFVGGLAWESAGGMRLGASYRPPIQWSATGNVDLELPEAIASLVELQGDGLTLETAQAGSLRAGWGYAGGTHPGLEDRPRFDVEANIIWENWSIVEAFETDPQGKLLLVGAVEQDLAPVVQPKNYQDTFALRVGSTFAAMEWVSLHLGGFLETAAQRKPFTNVDFVSWERYSGSLGATMHLLDSVDLTLSYAYVHSPSRTVTRGQVYNQIPLSRCTYPDYDQDPCAEPGTPPGNPQNTGEWSASYNIAGLGLKMKL